MGTVRDTGRDVAHSTTLLWWRRAALWLLAAAALSGQVVALWQVPEQFQQAVCWLMSLMWLAGLELVARLTRLRHLGVGALVSDGEPDPVAAASVEVDRQPSERMRAAWFMARAGGDTELVAHVAGVPHALAELIVADARSGKDNDSG